MSPWRYKFAAPACSWAVGVSLRVEMTTARKVSSFHVSPPRASILSAHGRRGAGFIGRRGLRMTFATCLTLCISVIAAGCAVVEKDEVGKYRQVLDRGDTRSVTYSAD